MRLYLRGYIFGLVLSEYIYFIYGYYKDTCSLKTIEKESKRAKERETKGNSNIVIGHWHLDSYNIVIDIMGELFITS